MLFRLSGSSRRRFRYLFNSPALSSLFSSTWKLRETMRFTPTLTAVLISAAFCVCGNVGAQASTDRSLTGDFDGNGEVDISDVNFYVGNIGSAANGPLTQLDLFSDGQITEIDLQIHIANYVQTSNRETGTFLGDLNLDGSVDVLGDAFSLIGNLGGFPTSYAQGDIDLDGNVSVLQDAFALIGNLGKTNATTASVIVAPGTDNIQAAIDSLAGAGGGIVFLEDGNYFLSESLTPKSGVDIIGEGFGTVLNWHSSVADTVNEPMIYSDGPLTDVHFQDFKLRGSIDPSDADDIGRSDNLGLFLEGGGLPSDPASMDLQNISLRRVEVRNFGSTGVHIKGVNYLDCIDLKCSLNGFADIDLYHNFYLLRTNDVLIEGGTYTNSPSGHGMRVATSENVTINDVSVTGNADHGIHLSNDIDLLISNSTVLNNMQDPREAARNIGQYGDNVNIMIINTDF